MLNDVGDRPQIYSSPAIIERRKRILAETRKLIAEQGITAFSMNEIGHRAGVAKRTLYNAFQTRERMIAAAIQEYFDEYVSKLSYISPPGTMEHNIERMISILQRNRKLRNYVKAVMSLYFSSDVDPDIWSAIHAPAVHHNRRWIELLAAKKQLQPWVDVDQLVDDLVRFEFATINEWAQARIADDEVTARLVSSYLGCVAGALKGNARKEVETLLKAIAERGAQAIPVPHADKAMAA